LGRRISERIKNMRPNVLLALGLVASSVGAQAPEPRSSEHHIAVGGRQRAYLVDLPPQYDGSRRMPLVLDFHGGGGSPAGARKQTGFSALAAREGVIVVYPAGSGRPGSDRFLTWNTEYRGRRHAGHLGFLREPSEAVIVGTSRR